jgi:hypothetical protein
MHLEAYVPVQAGLIAYEVCKGLATENSLKKLNDNFGKKVLKSLEKNALRACDMNQASRDGLHYRKLQYKIPDVIKKIMTDADMDDIGGEDEDTPWVNVLRNVNLKTVHLF